MDGYQTFLYFYFFETVERECERFFLPSFPYMRQVKVTLLIHLETRRTTFRRNDAYYDFDLFYDVMNVNYCIVSVRRVSNPLLFENFTEISFVYILF
jgi:hypothetical protein